LRGAEDPVPVSGDLCGRRGSWLDREVESGGVYVYRLEVTGDYGLTELYGPTEPVVMPGTARGLTLYEPYPSPAADVVALEYEIPAELELVTLTIYELSGRRLSTQTLESNPGRHTLLLDVGDYPRGVYLARLAGEEASRTLRFVINR
ncbi:MAG: T9SS type A sorting domain-containing protein, partial [Candidatus Coatesbacteria bacterium]|nr:T9SS type A sorting domain-containing protein [Candidatus Coatesbacteria bacterium]